MANKKLADRGDVKKTFSLSISNKWIENQDHNVLRHVACSAIQSYVLKQIELEDIKKDLKNT